MNQNNDLISRQVAIDIERNATVDTNPSHFEAHQKFTQFMDDAEVSSFGRWQWSNGFNTALTAVGIDLKKLPSAQPEPTQEIQDILDYLDTVLHPIVSPEHWDVYSKLHDMVSGLPSAQPDGIPLEWIDKHLEWLDNCDNDFAQLAKVSIKAMVELWKKDRI